MTDKHTDNQARIQRMEIAGDYAQLAYASARRIGLFVREDGRPMTEDQADIIRLLMQNNGYWSTEWRRDASAAEAAGAPPFLMWWGRRTCFDPVNDDSLE